mgnify:FL=1
MTSWSTSRSKGVVLAISVVVILIVVVVIIEGFASVAKLSLHSTAQIR